VKNRVGN